LLDTNFLKTFTKRYGLFAHIEFPITTGCFTYTHPPIYMLLYYRYF